MPGTFNINPQPVIRYADLHDALARARERIIANHCLSLEGTIWFGPKQPKPAGESLESKAWLARWTRR